MIYISFLPEQHFKILNYGPIPHLIKVCHKIDSLYYFSVYLKLIGNVLYGMFYQYSDVFFKKNKK